VINKILEMFKDIDKDVKKIMINGFKFSFIISIFSLIILITYNLYCIPILYYCGTILFKSSLMFFTDFIIMGFGFDKIKKQMAI
jgi:hypothetical protein